MRLSKLNVLLPVLAATSSALGSALTARTFAPRDISTTCAQIHVGIVSIVLTLLGIKGDICLCIGAVPGSVDGAQYFLS